MIESSQTAAASHFCRLCLSHDGDTKTNIFEEQLDDKDVRKQSMVQRLFDLFQIKYEKSSELPQAICQQCLHMTDLFTTFRENVLKCEDELQKWVEQRKRNSKQPDEQRPGLNGNPGVFLPDDDCIIADVDPEQEYETSDDDFSMESESDNEEESLRPASSLQLAHSTHSTHSTGSTATGKRSQLDTEVVAQRPATSAECGAAGDSSSAAHNSSAAAEVKNTFMCQYCDMAFTTQFDCSDHESRHDPTNPYVCSFCPLRANARQTLICHIKEAHDAERPFICALCNKGFCRRSDLKKHTIVHTGVRPFTCSVCGKSFSRNTNLTKHMRIHNSIKPHVCQHCPRSFSTAGELLRHTRSHSESKPFQCTRCTVSFTRKDKLVQHEQSHYRRDAEFLLNQGKTAATDHLANAFPNGLMENIVVPLNPFGTDHENHAGLLDDPNRSSILAAQLQPRPMAPSKPSKYSRNFTCEICAKKFTRERDLHRHSALHLDSLFACKQCGTTFNRREKLARHELEHHAPQYPCNICRVTFAQREALEGHMKMHELQQNAAVGGLGMLEGGAAPPQAMLAAQQPSSSRDMHRPPADISFYSQLPTMNLGFYSETRPEDRNGI